MQSNAPGVFGSKASSVENVLNESKTHGQLLCRKRSVFHHLKDVLVDIPGEVGLVMIQCISYSPVFFQTTSL